MRPERRSHGMTLMRTRIVVVPTIKLPSGERAGEALFQCMPTEGSSACVPESSIVVVRACRPEGQIMLNTQAKKKADPARRKALMAHSTYTEPLRYRYRRAAPGGSNTKRPTTFHPRCCGPGRRRLPGRR